MGASPQTPGIFPTRRSWGIALLCLAACGGPEAGPLNPGLPGEVVAQLPLDVDLDEVNRDPDGCFFYTYAATLFVVRDDAGNPICIPPK